MDIPSFIRRLNRRCFKSNLLLVKLFVMYRLSSLHHRQVAVSSSATSVMIWSSKTRSRVEPAFSSILAISIGRGFGAGFNKGVQRPWYLSNARILICYKLELFLPVLSNFYLQPLFSPEQIWTSSWYQFVVTGCENNDNNNKRQNEKQHKI